MNIFDKVFRDKNIVYHNIGSHLLKCFVQLKKKYSLSPVGNKRKHRNYMSLSSWVERIGQQDKSFLLFNYTRTTTTAGGKEKSMNWLSWLLVFFGLDKIKSMHDADHDHHHAVEVVWVFMIFSCCEEAELLLADLWDEVLHSSLTTEHSYTALSYNKKRRKSKPDPQTFVQYKWRNHCEYKTY